MEGPLPPGEGGQRPGEGNLSLRRKPTNEHLLENARKMRQEDTRAEKAAWFLSRDRNMFDLKFRREVPIESYIVDFYCHDLRLVIEIDGSIHADPDQFRKDEIRDIHLKELGYKILRVPNGMVLRAQGLFAEQIRQYLPSPGPKGHPLPEGEGPPSRSSKC
jgi:very-short-patch-repair endonuclease